MKIKQFLIAAFMMISAVTLSVTLVYTELSDPISMDPYNASDEVVYRLSSLLYRGLINPAPIDELRKEGLGEIINSDGRRYYIKLKPFVRWSDRSRVTARDVVFTFNVIRNPRVPTIYKSFVSNIQRIVEESQSELSVYFKSESPFNDYALSFPVISRMAFRGNSNITRRAMEYFRRPVSSGPYVLDTKETNFDSRTRFIFKRNNWFHGVLPVIDRVELRVIQDREIATQEAQNGGVDLIFDVLPEKRKPLENSGFSIFSAYEPKIHYVLINQRPPERVNYRSDKEFEYAQVVRKLLSRNEVRIALAHLMDREQMVVGIYYGEGRVVSGPFMPGSPYYDENIAPYPFDVEEAINKLERQPELERVGGKFKVRVGNSLRDFALKMVVYRGSEDIDKRVEIIKNAFNKAGVNLQIQRKTWAELYETVFGRHDFDLTTLSFSSSLADPALFEILHSEGTLNAGGYASVEMDKLIEEVEMPEFVLGLEERIEIYKKIHNLFHKEMPFIPLFTRISYMALRNTFEVPYDPTALNPFEAITLWRVNKH